VRRASVTSGSTERVLPIPPEGTSSGFTIAARLERMQAVLNDVQAYAVARRPLRMLRRLADGALSVIPARGGLLLLHYPTAAIPYLSFGTGTMPKRPPWQRIWPQVSPLVQVDATQILSVKDHPGLSAIFGSKTVEVLVSPVRLISSLTGALLLSADRPGTFSAEDVRLASHYTTIVGLTVAGTLVVQDLVRLLTITRSMAEVQNVDTLLQEVLHHAVALTNTEAASILLQETHTGKLAFAAAIGPDSERLLHMRVPMSSLAGKAVQEQRPIVAQNIEIAPDHFGQIDQAVGFHTRSLMAVPVPWHGEVIGALEVLNKQEGTFDDRDLDLLQTLATQVAVLIQNARLAAERKQAYEELKELDERKTQFIALISHELRTPLTIIQGHAEMLAEELEDEPSRMLLDGILEGTRKLTEVVEEITAMSHAENAGELEDAEPVDIRGAIRFALVAVENLAKVKGHAITTEIPDAPVVVWGSAELLQEAFVQLLGNAVKFTPDRGKIRVHAWQESAHAVVAVSDTGPGIPPEEHERIFQRFYQLENHLNRQHAGLGLGLSIARAVAEQHGGHVWVESEVGQGATFFIRLPLWEASPACLPDPQPSFAN